MKVWTTKDGHQMAVSEMDDKHLLNSIKMLQRATEKRNWRESLDSIGMASTFGGEMAQEACYSHSEELMRRKPAELYPIYKDMIAEAQRRGLDVDQWCAKCQRFHEIGQRACNETWCAACEKAHPMPINEHHRRALKCVAKE